MTLEAIATIIGSGLAVLAAVYKAGDKITTVVMGINRQLTEISYGLTGIKDDVSDLKADIKEMKEEFREQEIKVNTVQQQYLELKATTAAMLGMQNTKIEELHNGIKEIRGLIKVNSPNWFKRESDQNNLPDRFSNP